MPIDPKTQALDAVRSDIAARSHRFGYLRALLLAYMVIAMIRALAVPNVSVASYALQMIVGWIVWKLAGGIDARMDIALERIGERIAPYLPSGTKKKRG